MNKQSGFILPIVLILLFVLTIMTLSHTELLIIATKNQRMMYVRDQIFYRAESGIIQMEQEFMQKSMILPSSPIHLDVMSYPYSVDSCGNKTIDIESTANWNHQYAKLRTRDIFARVPVLAGCPIVSVFQRVWWQQNTERNEYEPIT